MLGCKNIKHLNQVARKHEVLVSCTELTLLGSIHIAVHLNSILRQNVMNNNVHIANNKYMLKRIIDCIKLCGKLGLGLRGQEEEMDSQNRRIFGELIFIRTGYSF